MKKLTKYIVGDYDIFRGRSDRSTWYVYDTKNEKYVGGSFDRKKDAEEYAKNKEQ